MRYKNLRFTYFTLLYYKQKVLWIDVAYDARMPPLRGVHVGCLY